MQLLYRLRDLVPLHARDSGIVFVGDVLAKLLTFGITIMLFRLVSPAEYALYTVFITVLATANQFTDSGLHPSVIRFLSIYRLAEPLRAQEHLRFAWRVKATAMLATSAVFLGAAGPMAQWLFLDPALETPLRFVGLCVLGSGIFEFLQAVYQARQQFIRLTVVRVTEAMGKLGFILLLIALERFSLDAVYAVYVLVTLTVGIVAWLQSDANGIPPRDWRAVGGEVLRFGKWMMLSSFSTMFLMRLDIFMLTPMLHGQQEAIGLYGAAVRLCTPLIVLAGSVSTVFTPRAMALRSYVDMRSYSARSLQVTLPMLVLSAAYGVALFLLVPVYFPKYAGSLPLFAVLWIGYAWTIVGNPLTILMVSINRPQVMTWISIAQLAATLVSHYILISLLGALGAALSTVVMWFIAGAVSMRYIYAHRFAIDDGVQR